MISCMRPFLDAGAEAVNFQHTFNAGSAAEFLSVVLAAPSRMQQSSAKPLLGSVEAYLREMHPIDEIGRA